VKIGACFIKIFSKIVNDNFLRKIQNEFEWNEQKALANLKKHDISFFKKHHLPSLIFMRNYL